MSHVDDRLVAPVIERFGRPAVWASERELDDHGRRMVEQSTGHDRFHDVTFFVLRRDETVVIRKPWFPPGAWRAPSGGIDPGETFAAGTAREAMEETGLEIELTGYPLVAQATFTWPGASVRWTTHVVTATASTEALQPVDVVEIAEARWMALDELVGAVAGVLRGSGSPLFAYRAELHDRVVERIR